MSTKVSEFDFVSQSFLDALPERYLNLNENERKIALSLYYLMAKGQAVRLEEIAAATALDNKVVDEIVDNWIGVFKNDAGSIIGFWGMGLSSMKHKLRMNDIETYAWCAIDTLFIPELLGLDAQINSSCPVTGKEISLEITHGKVTYSPESAVMSLVKPDKEFDSTENILTNFCHYVHFFIDKEAGDSWAAHKPGIFIVSIEEGYTAGKIKNDVQYR